MKLQLATALFLGIIPAAHAGFVGTAYPAGQWGASDATIGVTGYTIVDFESKGLPSGLGIQFVNGADGTTGNWNTGFGGNLPFIVSPADDTTGLDAFGPTYGGGAWDGTHYLVNVPNIPISSYQPTFGWGKITLYFLNGATSVGFSLQQQEVNTTVIINGTTTTSTSALGLAVSGNRDGYLRIDATGGSVINSLELDPGCCTDGWALDHLAFATTAPEPGTFGIAGVAALALLARLRRRSS